MPYDTDGYTSQPADDQIVKNLRFRWREELANYTDLELAAAYYHFGQSEMFGNNDEHFLEWINPTT